MAGKIGIISGLTQLVLSRATQIKLTGGGRHLSFVIGDEGDEGDEEDKIHPITPSPHLSSTNNFL